jgi:hypothetical protein
VEAASAREISGGDVVKRLGALLILVAVGVGACGGDDAAGEADYTSYRQVCELLQPDDLVAILGQPFDAGIDEASTGTPPAFGALVGATTCRYQSLPESGPTSLVYVGVVSAYAIPVLEQYKSDPLFGQPVGDLPAIRPVRDLGAEAVWSDKTGALVVRHDDMLLAVEVSISEIADPRLDRFGLTTRLATTVLDRL